MYDSMHYCVGSAAWFRERCGTLPTLYKHESLPNAPWEAECTAADKKRDRQKKCLGTHGCGEEGHSS